MSTPRGYGANSAQCGWLFFASRRCHFMEEKRYFLINPTQSARTTVDVSGLLTRGGRGDCGGYPIPPYPADIDALQSLAHTVAEADERLVLHSRKGARLALFHCIFCICPRVSRLCRFPRRPRPARCPPSRPEGARGSSMRASSTRHPAGNSRLGRSAVFLSEKFIIPLHPFLPFLKADGPARFFSRIFRSVLDSASMEPRRRRKQRKANFSFGNSFFAGKTVFAAGSSKTARR